MILLGDLETNGLELDENTRIHCIVLKDWETKEVWKYGPQDLENAYVALMEADRIIFHNFIGFDWRVLLFFFHDFNPKSYDDTLILSRLFYPYKRGGHFIENYGEECGIPKPVHEDWSTFSPEMLHRCVQDVHILDYVYSKLMKQRLKGDANWEEAIKLEYEVARIHHHIQVPTGITFDVDKAAQLRDTIDMAMSSLEIEMRKVLPLHTVKGSTIKKVFKKNGDYQKYVRDYIGG